MTNPTNASVVEGNGGLQKVRVASPDAEGEMYLHGAHVTSWKPAGREEVLFLSSKSRWEDGQAIRGGIPISFPWFAGKVDDPTAPAHGFVRTKAWQLDSISQTGDGVRVSMFTESSSDTKRWWPADFHLACHATFGSQLRLELAVTNTGNSAARFEEALHAYYRLDTILSARIKGLDAASYLDKTDSNRKKIQTGEIAVVSETDRIYLDTAEPIDLEEPGSRRRVRIAKEHSRTTVIWNPWMQKAQSMPDLGDGEWKRMICIEASNVGDCAIDLGPGQQHTMKAIASVLDL